VVQQPVGQRALDGLVARIPRRDLAQRVTAGGVLLLYQVAAGVVAEGHADTARIADALRSAVIGVRVIAGLVVVAA
jgi:hypothetical protein